MLERKPSYMSFRGSEKSEKHFYYQPVKISHFKEMTKTKSFRSATIYTISFETDDYSENTNKLNKSQEKF